MKKKLSEFWGDVFVIIFGLALLMGFVFLCELAAGRILGLPFTWLPFFLVGTVLICGSMRHIVTCKRQ
jgi:hypothetical protein